MKRTLLILASALFAFTWVNAQNDTADSSESDEKTIVKSSPTNPSEVGPDGKPVVRAIPSGKPLIQTEIEAEHLRAEIKEDVGYMIGIGSVKVTATNLVITCNQIEVFTDAKEKKENDSIGDFSSIQKVIATGNVRIVQEERIATAGRAEVLPNEDVILLDKDPIVYQGAITIDGTGAQLKIHRGNGQVEMIGDSTHKVRITGPAIQDFGFEDDGETIVPPEPEDPPETPESDSDSEPKEEAETEEPKEKSKDENSADRPRRNQ